MTMHVYRLADFDRTMMTQLKRMAKTGLIQMEIHTDLSIQGVKSVRSYEAEKKEAPALKPELPKTDKPTK